MNENTQHGGNLRELLQMSGGAREDLIDFSASINPLGPPDCLRSVISRNIERLAHYPDPHAEELVEALSQKGTGKIVVGNGSTEILFALVRALKPRQVVIPVPSYGDYAQAAHRAGSPITTLKLEAAKDFALDWSALAAVLTGQEMVILGQPNNPTGQMFDVEEFRRFAAQHVTTTFVVDEAFADFVMGYTTVACNPAPTVVGIRSLTKFYAIPGLRLGYAIAQAELAGKIREEIPPWSVNTLAQAVGAAILKEDDYTQRTRELITEQREAL